MNYYIGSTVLGLVSLFIFNKYLKNLQQSSIKKTVVVVGGGYAGMMVCKILDSKFNVILIEQRNAFFHKVGSPRILAEYEYYKKLYMSYENIVRYGRVIHQTAIDISSEKVVLKNGEEVTFDYLVIATGTTNPGPYKSNLPVHEAPQFLHNLTKTLKDAKKILIVGGGGVGVEVAGEIVHLYNDKEITIISHSEKLVCKTFSDKFHTNLQKKLSDHNIQVIVDKLQFPKDQQRALEESSFIVPFVSEKSVYTTDSGRQLEADLVFWTVGNKLNNTPLQNHFYKALNENGRVKVNRQLQVEGYQNIFAVGDINNIDEMKNAYHAHYHGTIAANNIISLDSSKDKINAKLSSHKSMKPSLVVSFGPSDGIGQMYGWYIGSYFATIIQSKHLFTDTFYQLMNKPKPIYFSKI
ncbi:hypothetical protein DLAC_11604 [Tieghemostelium lacteum]|uniref:FAD/NAD(P)-binding domain-containing protein n=1 Tax=Tieghemostelium lacteum TaxID=361077 RepID=A0A151ZIZ8_TIELA|nr:hypothetical protein DLAC_11604 [Tieghemostelium lacteum]|eukprot:KYQ93971.1 hypothetical protein DLAC_11604 [Tieghemostelium lacteum]